MATLDMDKLANSFSGGTRQARLYERMSQFCPLPALIAYWSPPSAWPRRVFCETKLPSCTITKTCWIILAAILLTYFLVMDIFLFSRYRTVNLVTEARAGEPGEIYSPFTHLTIKAILSDHVRHYVFTPSAEYFNAFTHFTSIFSFVTANMVSITHLICAFISGKFVASENLLDRRVGVILYFLRTWLDSLDGIVYRAHAGRYLQYNSVYSTLGYLVDGLVDTLGGFFLSFGVLFYLFKRFGPSRTMVSLPTWTNSVESTTDIAKASNGCTVTTRKESHSYLSLFLKTLSYGVSLGVAGICWDRAVKEFSEVFQLELKDPNLAATQYSLSHSHATVLIFFLWRFISGQTVLNYMLVAIYMDKIWEFLQWTQWILLLITVPLYGATHLYVLNIRTQLQL